MSEGIAAYDIVEKRLQVHNENSIYLHLGDKERRMKLSQREQLHCNAK